MHSHDDGPATKAPLTGADCGGRRRTSSLASIAKLVREGSSSAQTDASQAHPQ